MITQELLDANEPMVIEAIDEVFSAIKTQEKRENDLVLLLANCSINPKSEELSLFTTFSYDDFTDNARFNFILFYLSLPIHKQYHHEGPKSQSIIRKNLIFQELMIYSHIWESISNLKLLFKLTELTLGNDYPWNIEVPDMRKHKFVRHEVRDRIPEGASKLQTLISNSFNSQLRNAFAHSQISFWNDENEVIQLHNHDENDGWTSWGMSFTDFESKLINSILLFKAIHDRIKLETVELVKRNNEFDVYCPEESGIFSIKKIYYNTEANHFKWRR